MWLGKWVENRKGLGYGGMEKLIGLPGGEVDCDLGVPGWDFEGIGD